MLNYVSKHPLLFFRIIRLIYSNGELYVIDDLNIDLLTKPLYLSPSGSLENKDIAAKIGFEYQCELFMRSLQGNTNIRVTFSDLGYHSSNVSIWPVRNRIIAIFESNGISTRIGNVSINSSILKIIGSAPHC